MSLAKQSVCGCWFPSSSFGAAVCRAYIPLIKFKSHTTILSCTSRTRLTQTFVNAFSDAKELQYSFPLYDGVSLVTFDCLVGKTKIHGVVKEKEQAGQEYEAAVDRGEVAALLSQVGESADVFTTKIGNVPAGQEVQVTIEYIGELKHDLGNDAIRFSIPTKIAPRYGSSPAELPPTNPGHALVEGGIDVIVDVVTDENSPIRQIQSPSHPISVTIGRTSQQKNKNIFVSNNGSASLSLNETELDKDFVILIEAKDADLPRALLETHSSVPHQRCLMTTLVPRFKLPQQHPEIVYIIDRSGSMAGQKMETVMRSLSIMLRSLPLGIKFNLCSFGSHHSFLWPRSKSYNKANLDEASKHVKSMQANFGGTEIFEPLKATVANRYKDMKLEIIVLTDGQVWNAQDIYDFVRVSVAEQPIRVFGLGIGNGASSGLVEGIAAAGNGLAQFVDENEKHEKKMLRLLKSALTPHISNYSLEVKFEEDDFDMVEKTTEKPEVNIIEKPEPDQAQGPISLFDKCEDSADELDISSPQDRYAHLPLVSSPTVIQAPHQISAVYPYNRTVVFSLLGSEHHRRQPIAVVLRGDHEGRPVELQIPIQDMGKGETLHQLAAKKTMQEHENGGGWLSEMTNEDGLRLKDVYDGRWEDMVARESVHIGTTYQVVGKWCSFVAVQEDTNGLTEELSKVDLGRTAPADHTAIRAAQAQVAHSLQASLFSGAFDPACEVDCMKSGPPSNTQPTGGLFGSQQAQMQNVPRNQAMPGFGQPKGRALFDSQQPRMQNASSGNLFGGSPQPSSSLFGSQRPPMQNASSGNHVYGGAAQPSGSQFGQPTMQNAYSGGLFGSMSQPSQGLFGQSSSSNSPNVQSGAHKGGLFGAQSHSIDQQSIQFNVGSLFGPANPINNPPPRVPVDEDVVTPMAPETDEDRMHVLISLQNFDGSWEWSKDLAKIIDLKSDESEIRLLTKSDVFATAMAIAFFESIVPEEDDAWELVVGKAKAWLKDRFREENEEDEEIRKCQLLLQRARQ
ncbi:MAG: VIT domain-containing protein [Janthinobacterium lividum]